MNEHEVEQAVCVAGLHCSAAAVRETGLQPNDFSYPSTRDIWRHVLRMTSPSQLLLMNADAELGVTSQGWINLWAMSYAHPAALAAHAALVKQESVKRAAQQGHRESILALENGNTTNAAVSLEYTE